MSGDRVTQVEPAVPPHLQVERTEPRALPEGYQPPFPAVTGRFAPEVDSVVMAYLGVQSGGPDSAAHQAALADLRDLVGAAPRHRERARCVDGHGNTDDLMIAYWYAAHGASWTSLDRTPDGVGRYLEAIAPSTDRFETLFSATDRPEGAAVIADGLSGPVAEHAYWGAMRDRLAVAQHDPLAGHGGIVTEGVDRRKVVGDRHNLCLIRSGQDLDDAGYDERSFYYSEVEPVLRAGMDFLRYEGRSVGCYSNRYLTVLDDTGATTRRTFGMSWWDDLASLEAWAKSHPTHVRIFGAAMRHLSTFGETTRLRLFHEVSVVPADAQWFEYLGCREGTGLLADAAVAR